MLKFGIGVVVGAVIGRPAVMRVWRPLQPIIFRKVVLVTKSLVDETAEYMEQKIWEEGKNY